MKSHYSLDPISQDMIKPDYTRIKNYKQKKFFGLPEVAGIRGECWFPDPAAEGAQADATAYSDFAMIPVQVHSNDVVEVDSDSTSRPEGDAVVTFEPGVRIGVVTADCVPIILYAPDIRGVAAVHAGWKGSLGGIIDNTISLFTDKGADTSKMSALFGPSISGEVYEVNEEMGRLFAEAGFGDCVFRGEGVEAKPHIDLQGVNVKRLRRCGLLPENIHESSYCTFLSTDEEGRPLLPSHRRSGGNPARLLTSVILTPL